MNKYIPQICQEWFHEGGGYISPIDKLLYLKRAEIVELNKKLTRVENDCKIYVNVITEQWSYIKELLEKIKESESDICGQTNANSIEVNSWKPTKGEFCLFYNDCQTPTLAEFNCVVYRNKEVYKYSALVFELVDVLRTGITENKVVCCERLFDYCEQFTGKIPDFLKLPKETK